MNVLDEGAIPCGAAIVIDRIGYIVGWNEGAEAVLGFAAKEVIGRACHDILCGRDPEGQLVCHPWCALSPGDGRVNPDEDVVLYPRSAARDVLRVTISGFPVGGADGTSRWVVHQIISVESVPTKPEMPWHADPAWRPRPQASVRSMTAQRLVEKPKPPETSRH